MRITTRLTTKQIELLKKKLIDSEEIHNKDIDKLHAIGAARLSQIISRFFTMYGDGTYLPHAALLEPLTAKERKQYPKRIKTRMDALLYELTLFFKEEGKAEIKAIQSLQKEVITETWTTYREKEPTDRQVKAIQSRSEAEERTNDNKIKQAAAIWLLLRQAMVRGETVKKTIITVRDKYQKRADTEAKRLAYTEDTFLANETLKEAGKTEKYVFMTAGDGRVCDTCRPLHLHEFEYKERVVGVNYPPMHPWCRCLAIPIEEEDEEEDKT